MLLITSILFHAILPPILFSPLFTMLHACLVFVLFCFVTDSQTCCNSYDRLDGSVVTNKPCNLSGFFKEEVSLCVFVSSLCAI